MNKIMPLFVVVVGFLLGACGPKLSLEGARVKLLAPTDELGSCQPISNVDGSGGSKEGAEVAIRNKAGKMNADRVVVSDTLEASGKVKLVGKAYSCSAAQQGGPNG